MGDSLEPKLIDRQVIAVAAIAIVARLVWIALFARTPTGQSDPAFYNEAATRRIDGEGYCSLLGEPTAYYPPGYPAVLSWMNRLSDAIGPEAAPCHLISTSDLEDLGLFRAFSTIYAIAVPPGIFGRSPPCTLRIPGCPYLTDVHTSNG